MRTTKARWITSIAAALAVVVIAGVAQAQSKKVLKALKGSLIISSDVIDIPDGGDKEVIKTLKKAHQDTLKHFAANGVAAWQFNFIAFMKKPPGTTEISLDFYTADKEKLYVANKRLTGVDAKLTVLRGRVDISEDDNVNKNRKYVVKLTTTRGGKETVLATTELTFK